MQQYRDVRKHHSLVEICKKPELAAEVTITAAEFLKVDAAIIFADLLLPLEVMGLPFHFSAGEGPVIEKPVRTAEDVKRAAHRSRRRTGICRRRGCAGGRSTSAHKLPVIGFCGAPFTLASYMVEGGGSRHYLEVKKLMYNSPEVWDELVGKLVDVLAEYAAEQVRAGADVLQIFDSWVGCLSVEDYRRYALLPTTQLIQRLQKETSVPDHLLRHRQRHPAALDGGDRRGGHRPGLAHSARRRLAAPWDINRAVQGNLDPVLLFASWRGVEAARRTHSSPGRRPARAHLQSRPRHSAAHAGGQREGPGAICARVHARRRPSGEDAMSKQAVLLIAHGSPERVEDIPEFLQNISRGRPMPEAVVREVQHRYSLIGSSPLTRITQAAGGRRGARAGHSGLRRHAQLASVHRRHVAADGCRRRGPGGCDLPGAAQFAHQRRTVQAGAVRERARRSPSISSRSGTIIRC